MTISDISALVIPKKKQKIIVRKKRNKKYYLVHGNQSSWTTKFHAWCLFAHDMPEQWARLSSTIMMTIYDPHAYIQKRNKNIVRQKKTQKYYFFLSDWWHFIDKLKQIVVPVETWAKSDLGRAIMHHIMHDHYIVHDVALGQRLLPCTLDESSPCRGVDR